MEWIGVKDNLPTNGDTVYSKGSDGRVFKSQFRVAQNKGAYLFGLCGYVWDHSNVTEWKPYDGLEVISGYQE